MVASRGSVRFNSSGSNPSPQSSSAGVYGQWTPNGFAFTSPEQQTNWHRDAYRQAVSHENWHKGQIVDPGTAHLIDAGVAGPTPPTFRGPDGQLRYFGTQTAEAPDVAGIRARHFRGAKRADLEGSTMPGESEAVAQMAGTIPSNSDQKSSSPIARTEVALHPQKKFQPSVDRLTTTHLIKSQDSPLALGGKLILASESVPNNEASYPEGGQLRAPTPDESPIGRYRMPNVNDNYRSPANSNEPEPSDEDSTSFPSAKTNMGLETNRANALERVAHDAIFGDARDDNYIKNWIARAEASKDVEAMTDAADWAVTYAEPTAIHDFTYNSRDWDQPANPVEIDAVRSALQDQVLKYFSQDAQNIIRQHWVKPSTTIKNGAIGLQSALSLFRNADRLSVMINGQEALPEIDNPIVVGGRLGGKAVRRLDAITDEEVKKKIAACVFPGIQTVGGGAPYLDDDGKEKRHKQFWIQDLLDRKNAKGARYMDVTVRFKIGSENCDLHINTVDVARSGIIKEHEWEAIQDAAKKMSRNGELLETIQNEADRMLRDILVSRMNTFLTIPKMDRNATDDEIRAHVNDFLDLLSCSDIEAACKSGKVNIFDGRDKVPRHGT